MSDATQALGPGAARQQRTGTALPPCLGCRTEGKLARVPVVFDEGRDEIDLRGRVGAAVYGLPATIRGRAVRETELAKKLAPPRPLSGGAGPAVLAGVVILALAAGATASSSAGVALLGWLLIATLVFVGVVLLRRRGSRRTNPQRTFRRALWLWNRCWYCRRCGTVSLFTPNGSKGLDPSNLAGALTDLAEGLRWPGDEASAKA